MSEAAVDERRMTDAEGLMWRLEKDPHLSSTFGLLSMLDRPPDFDRLQARMERAVAAVPRLGWRIQPAPVNLTAPLWVDDPDFDIDHHVRRIALPKAATARELNELATMLVLDPFDRTRPLWQFIVIEGLRGGKAAMVQKMHHTISDGEGLAKISLQYLDFERDAPPPPPIVRSDDALVGAPPAPSALESVRDLVVGGFRLPLAVTQQVRQLLADPASIPATGTAVVDTVRAVMTQLSDTEGAHSPLWTQRSLKRRLEVARAPFRETKDAAKRLGGTVNTAFVTAATEAAARYHRERGAPVETLRATMAVSTRTDAKTANAFSLARIEVPTEDMPIAERFRAIQDLSSEARHDTSRASLSTLAAVAAALPTSLVTRLARQQSQTIDFATSNVRGAPVPMYISGAQLVHNYPMGPLAGVAFNLTLLSYLGSLDMGLNVDAAAVEDPLRLAKLIEQAFKALARA